MRKILENLDVEWGIQHVRDIKLAVEGVMESLLDFRGTHRRHVMPLTG